ncbi:putative PAS/PAC sensor protein [Pirellula staleyi DSM 6068]|uniref:Putative PAS/PAC sensor protein n=1 Tax=Pirellula staleyi (strain ATCC 27377 / DSM 6068 / ICPB 4128) TaxID=530564 RepID=D2R587_PIRSD|nr:putative PAS/PAC sensor protein [Pirellula staleyi DSM 6068]
MSVRRRILFVCSPHRPADALPSELRSNSEVVEVHHPLRAIARLMREKFDGVYVAAEHFNEAVRLGRLLENDRILEGMPDAVALLDADSTILWANERLRSWSHRGNIVGESFFQALSNPEVVGSELTPFTSAVRLNRATTSTLKTSDGRYLHLHAAPVTDPKENTRHLVVTARDVTVETQQQQKLHAIQDAGRELADLKPDEIFDMPIEQRVDLLKANILHCTKDLLKFDVVEIRLIDEKNNQLVPLLEMGMDPEAANRILYADKERNGVTGFVAATGKSYLCEDTASDPMYLQGVKDAKSSLTVPLKLHNEVIGTFNVESPQPGAFSDSDLQFLEIFCRDLAVSLNTLQLLAAQRANACQESVEAIHSEVALPIDEILSDAIFVTERTEGLPPEMQARLQTILRNARDIKRVIQNVGRKMAPADAVPAAQHTQQRPKLVGRRVLVVDAEQAVRSSAHALLERYGCVVETAQRGAEAEMLYQHSLRDGRYDVVLTGTKLPDMSGYDLMMRLKRMVDPVPLILMSEFGWDAGHTLVKARQAGLHTRGNIMKPFILPQLLDTVEVIIEWSLLPIEAPAQA